MESRAAFQDGRGLRVSLRGGKEAGETVGRYDREKGCFAEQTLRLTEERASLPGSREGRVRASARGPAEESRSMASNFSAQMSVSEGKLESGRRGRCDIE